MHEVLSSDGWRDRGPGSPAAWPRRPLQPLAPGSHVQNAELPCPTRSLQRPRSPGPSSLAGSSQPDL